MKHLKNWIAALIIAIAMSCAYMLDSHAEMSEPLERPHDATAYRLCAAIGGPNVGYTFNEAGKLICTTKRGAKLKEQPK